MTFLCLGEKKCLSCMGSLAEILRSEWLFLTHYKGPDDMRGLKLSLSKNPIDCSFSV